MTADVICWMLTSATADATKFPRSPSKRREPSRYVDVYCTSKLHINDVQELVLRVDRIESGELTAEQTLNTDF